MEDLFKFTDKVKDLQKALEKEKQKSRYYELLFIMQKYNLLSICDTELRELIGNAFESKVLIWYFADPKYPELFITKNKKKEPAPNTFKELVEFLEKNL